MMRAPRVGEDQLDRDYHGLPVHRLDNGYMWLEVLRTAGPRIVRLGLSGSNVNLLAETPDIGWETALGRYELFGGHRLWVAPEDSDLVAVPDSIGMSLTETKAGVRLDGAPEPATGLARSISIELVPDAAAVELRHRLSNVGDRTVELAPWSITQLPSGGLVRLPQSSLVSEHRVRPNRLLVLWPYTSWEDARLELCDAELRIRADPGPHLKVGSFVGEGTVSYARDGVTLTCRFLPQTDSPHPDMGCNVEVYVCDQFAELEILGPLIELTPGGTATLDERWELASG